jgi:hypothetical protein
VCASCSSVNNGRCITYDISIAASSHRDRRAPGAHSQERHCQARMHAHTGTTIVGSAFAMVMARHKWCCSRIMCIENDLSM